VQGFLNLNKPPGWTSHDCVAKVRRLLSLRRVGHAGTLDPAATGVLPIAVGKATRLLQFLCPDKAYRATIRFGLRTATDDLEGEILSQAPVPWLTLESVQALLPTFQGEIQQVPPQYSAIQVQGQRLYDLARSGQTVTVPSRQVRVHRLEVLAWRSGDFPELDLAIACGPGTYIRAIARDLGENLGTGATLAALERTESSGFALADSLTLVDLEAQRATISLIPPEVALAHLSRVTLPEPLAQRWQQGQRLPWTEPPEPGVGSFQALSATEALRVYNPQGQLLGIGCLDILDQSQDVILGHRLVLN